MSFLVTPSLTVGLCYSSTLCRTGRDRAFYERFLVEADFANTAKAFLPVVDVVNVVAV